MKKFFLLFTLIFLFACSSSKRIGKDYMYFQRGLDSIGRMSLRDPTIKPSDLLSIQVFSKTLNQEQAALFNIPNIGINSSNGYLVDINGMLELPLIGPISAAGLTRTQLRSHLVLKLSPYVKDPSVLIRFMQFRVNVLGEVRSPGTYNFTTERVTIFDAISSAGDLTVDAKRMGVVVVREEGNGRKYYTLDLRSGAVFQSPAFQLQQNDIVYIEANANKLATIDVNPKAQRNLQLGLTVASFVALIANLVAIFTR